MGGRGSKSGISAKGPSESISIETTSETSEELQKFRGKAQGGGWHYGDSSSENEHAWVKQFFKENTNAYELIDSMSSIEREAFLDWTRGHFMSGQQYGKFSDMNQMDRELTKIYDKYIDQATLNKGIVTYRRAGWELLNNGSRRSLTEKQLDQMVMDGTIITSKGSMSTGAAREGLAGMGDSKPVEYEFSFAKGSTGAGMWVGDNRINGWGAKQREYMTNRDTSYKMTGYRYDKKRDIYVINLTYIGRQEHNYS